jgi:ABC-type nitrate/sulfonate/bicarbonate transport system permease component
MVDTSQTLTLFRKQHPMISATKLRNLLGLGAALGIWQLTVSAGWVNEFMMPSPMDVVKAIGALAADGSLREHLSELAPVGMGYLIAAAIGLPIGFLCGMWKSASEVIRPVIEALRPIPPLAWVPIAILWFGLGDASAYFLVFLGCFSHVLRCVHSSALHGPKPHKCRPLLGGEPLDAAARCIRSRLFANSHA